MRPALFAVIAGVLLWSTVGTATPKKADAERQARALYRSGLSSHNLADYPAAIADFKHAYALTHAPGLLFNLAQSYRLAKDYEQALHFYRTYLRDLPNAPNRHDTEGLIVKVEALLRAQEAKPMVAPAAPKPEPEVRVVLVPAPEPARLPVVVVDTAKPKVQRRTLLVAGLVTLGVGVAALGAGLGAGLHAADQASAIDRLRLLGAPWDAQAQSTYTDGMRSSNAAVALWVVGGVLAATGVTITVVGGLRPRDTKLALSAHPLAGGGRLEVSCAF